MPNIRRQPRDPRHMDQPRSADANRNSEARPACRAVGATRRRRQRDRADCRVDPRRRPPGRRGATCVRGGADPCASGWRRCTAVVRPGHAVYAGRPGGAPRGGIAPLRRATFDLRTASPRRSDHPRPTSAGTGAGRRAGSEPRRDGPGSWCTSGIRQPPGSSVGVVDHRSGGGRASRRSADVPWRPRCRSTPLSARSGRYPDWWAQVAGLQRRRTVRAHCGEGVAGM